MVEPDVEMKESGVRRVNVKSMQGQVRTVELHPDGHIRDLKSKIALVFDVPAERQRLIYQGKLLRDESRLSEFIKEDGCTVHMMVKAEDEAARRPPPPSVPGEGGPPGVPMMFPEGGFQVQFGPGLQFAPGMQFSPGVQFVQAPQPGVPVQIRFQAPPQGVPVPPPPPQSAPPQQSAPQAAGGRAEERKVREIQLPFNHIHNLGHIINSMMGPNSSFPHPPMPQLPVNRNTLVLLGGFLYNYQFQLMRLIPFLSRLGDLLQRESLITDPQQRGELQRFSRAMGNALNEINQATQPVVELFQHIDIGPQAGQYHLRVHDASVVGQAEARPQPSQSNAQAQNPGQALISSLLNPASLPADSPLARMAPTLQQALGGSMGNMSLRDLMLAANVHENEEDLPLTEFVYNLTLPELTTLMSGDVAPLERIRPVAAQSLKNAMGGVDSPEGRERLLQLYDQYIRTHLVMPENFVSRQRPGFNYIQSTSTLVQRSAGRLIAMVLEDASNEFGMRFKKEFQLRVGEWAEAIIAGMEGGAQTLDLLLRTQLQASFTEVGGGEQASALLQMSYGVFQQLLVTCLQMRRLEREAQDPATALLDTWSGVIEGDVARQGSLQPQPPFSRAYKALDVLKPAEATERPQPKKLLRSLLSQSLQDSGVVLQGAEMSSDLMETFIQQLGRDIKERAERDPDYEAGRLRNVEMLRRR